MRANSKNAGGDEARSTPPSRPRLPPLKSLLAFEAAARHGSFTDGAQEIGITASAVSHHVSQVEDFLGVPLFKRHAGRVVLTVAGRTYARELGRAFETIAGATRLVAPHSQGGDLTIAVPNSFSVKWLQPRLERFIKANPLVRIRLVTLHTHELDAHRFDIAIAHGPQPPGLKHAEPLLVERLRPLCSPELAKRLNLRDAKDLARATLIHSNNPVTWVDYLRSIGSPAFKPTHDLWLDRSAMAVEAAVNGLGVILESEVIAGEELKEGRLLEPLAGHNLYVENISYFLVRSSSRRNASQVVAFETWLRAEFDEAKLRSLG